MQPQITHLFIQEEDGAQVTLEKAGDFLHAQAEDLIQRRIRHRQAGNAAQGIGLLGLPPGFFHHERAFQDSGHAVCYRFDQADLSVRKRSGCPAMVRELQISHQVPIRAHGHEDGFTQAGSLGKILQPDPAPERILRCVAGDERLTSQQQSIRRAVSFQDRPVNGDHMFRQPLEGDLSLKGVAFLLIQQEPDHFHREEAMRSFRPAS